MTKETSASGSALAAGSSGFAPSAAPSDSSFCGLNAGIFADNSDTESDRLADTRTNGRTRTTSRLPTRLVIDRRTTWRAPLDSPAGGSLSALRAPASRSTRAAQRALDALRQRREMRLAVERCEDGAAHEGRAAKAGQDRAGKPLRRNATAVDDAMRLAVDRQRRLVAEVDRIGFAPHPV